MSTGRVGRTAAAAAVVLALAGCGTSPPHNVAAGIPPQPIWPEEMTPRQRRAYDNWQREERLVSLALAGSPELRAAIRRAAEESVAATDPPPAPPPPGRRQTREQIAAEAVREHKIRQEEERLTRVVTAVATQRAGEALARQAEAACAARGRLAEATYPDRSLLRLDAGLAGWEARRACLDYVRAIGQVPAF